MPEPYWPKRKGAYTLSMAERNRTLVRVRCPYCKRVAHYHPVDLIEIYGDIEVDDLMRRMKCEAGNHATLDVRCISPSASEAVGIKVRRLTGILLQRVPLWKEG
jgi:hypothetical protein